MAKEIKENLGNYDTVVQILRTAVDEFLTYLGTTKDDPEARAAWMTKMCSKLGDLFLGRSNQYEAVEVWNGPGLIDAYLAGLYPFPTEDPKERMRWFFVVFFTEITELNDFAATPGVLEEQWKPSGAQLFQRFAMMLLGIPTDESSDAESESFEVKESTGLSVRQKQIEGWDGQTFVSEAWLQRPNPRLLEVRDGDGDGLVDDGKPTQRAAEPKQSKPKTSKPKAKLTDEEKQQAFEKLIATKSDEDKAAFRKSKSDGVSIPIAWTDVVYHGKDANIIAEGRDSKGRKQRAERPDYRQGLSDQNNDRIAKTLTPKMDRIRKQLRKDALAGNEESKVLYLIAMTGFRIGGKGDGKAETEAFGASTLRGEHVKIDGDTVTFDFSGKKGVRQQHSLKDSVVASWFDGVKPDENLFKTKDVKVREAWQEKYGGVKVHDIRHVVASELAKTNLAKLIPPKPKNKKESDALKTKVGTIVGKKLGNNPSQAIGTYIDPSLWKVLQVA